MAMIRRVLAVVGRGRPYGTVVVPDLPARLARRVLYVVEEDGHREHASMLCPCRCGAAIHLNLAPDDKPLWRLSTHPDGTASLSPSVHRIRGCRAHFWFRTGKVMWCEDAGASWWRRLLSRWL